MRLLSVIIAITALGLAGCPDNSGGLPPDGTALEEYTSAALEAGSLFCGQFTDDAFLIHDGAEAQAFLDSDCTQADQAAADELVATADALEEDEAIVILSIQLGGCLGEYGVFGFYLSDDESTVTGWVKRSDSSYGRQNVGCNADIGEAIEVWRVMGAAVATDAAILVGTYNAELPGAPALPGD